MTPVVQKFNNRIEHMIAAFLMQRDGLGEYQTLRPDAEHLDRARKLKFAGSEYFDLFHALDDKNTEKANEILDRIETTVHEADGDAQKELGVFMDADDNTHWIPLMDVGDQDKICAYLDRLGIAHSASPDGIRLDLSEPGRKYRVQRFLDRLRKPIKDEPEGHNVNFQRDLRKPIDRAERPQVGQTVMFDDRPYLVSEYGPNGSLKIIRPNETRYAMVEQVKPASSSKVLREFRDLCEYTAMTVRGGFSIPVSNEEQNVLDRLKAKPMSESEFDDREQELARKMYSRGLIRKSSMDPAKYTMNTLDNVWFQG